jgi:hypothetical protein
MSIFRRQVVTASIMIILGISTLLIATGRAEAASGANSNSANCTTTPPPGIIEGHYTTSSHTTGVIKNNSNLCSYQVGIASYKAYYPYGTGPNKVWLYSQTFYSSKTVTLAPGKSVTLTVEVPNCAWQSDIFWGSVLKQFSSTQLYSAQNRLLDGGWFETSLPPCSKTPAVTPTPMVTAMVTAPPALPSTGPGDAMVVGLIGLVGGLVGLKYWKLS